MSTGAPWWAFIVTAAIAILGWFLVNALNTKREIKNWKRSELLKISSQLITLSSRRNRLLLDQISTMESNDAVFRSHFQQAFTDLLEMQSVLDQFELLKEQDLHDRAKEIVQLHIDADKESDQQDTRDEYMVVRQAIVDTDSLAASHKVFIQTFHRTTRPVRMLR